MLCEQLRPLVPTIHGKSIIRRVLDEAFNQGNLAILDALVAPNGISHHSSWGTPANRMGLKQLIAMFRTAFPDLLCTIEDEIIQGNKIASHWKMRGTHTGIFLGNPPTSKPIVVQGLIYGCIENDQIIESWLMIDQMGILQQLGLVPPPRPTKIL
jgi:predicted ester cyclase